MSAIAHLDAPMSARARAREAELLSAGLRENSNLEMDWLWLAMQLTDPDVRRFCLRRALAINPESAIALEELQRLDRAHPDDALMQWAPLGHERA